MNRSTRESLAAAGGVDVEATLASVGSGSDGDADRTAGYAIGTAMSEGQRFRVLRPHARGGLGAVFVAMDGELNREVALKQILDDHADDPTSRQRFLLEAEVTGGLEHPGIVPVYGLGTYGDGRPYYAMRFIRGDSLKVAIDRFHADLTLESDRGRRSLELRKLLRRFTDVCNAIDYAHSRGVLHRDIKPGNIIVGKHGETLVVDWGLAKTTSNAEPGTEERTLVPSSASGSAETLPGSVLGTPAYMSPEQARGELKLLGPRSDVYSLGATLYCLLTGKSPQESDDVGERLRMAQRAEFPPPRQVDSSIDPALEAVCLKAMALKPEDRYSTPRMLAEDIDRWMADESITAWREPVSRRVLRWLTRHRTGVTAVGVALVVALAGTGAVLAVQTWANQELKRSNFDLAIANQQVTRANADLKAAGERERQRFDLAMEAIKLFSGDVSEDLLLKQKLFQALRAKLLEGASGFYGKLQGLLDGQPDPQSRSELGRAYAELAELTSRIGKTSDAVALHRKGLAVRRELASQPGADADATLDVVRSLHELGVLLGTAGDRPGRLASYEEAYKLAVGLVNAGRGSDEARFELARCLSGFSAILPKARQEEALQMARRAVATMRELVLKNPSMTRYQEWLGECLRMMGYVVSIQAGRPDEGIAFNEEAVTYYQKLADAQPDAYRFRNRLAQLHNNIAASSWDLGKVEDAVTAERQALLSWRKSADAYPAVNQLANNVAFGLNNLGDFLNANGRPAEALEALSESRPIVQKLSAVRPELKGLSAQSGSEFPLHRQGGGSTGVVEGAQESFEKAAAIWLRLADEDPSSKNTYQSEAADILGLFGQSLLKAGRSAQATTVFARERSIRQRLADAVPANASYRGGLANCETNTAAGLIELGRLSEARACCDRAIAALEDLLKGDPKDEAQANNLAMSLLRSGSVRMATGDDAGAAADWRRAVSLYASHRLIYEAAIFRACCHGALAGLAARPGTGVSDQEGAAHADQAMAILRSTFAGGYRDLDLLQAEHGLDPLRSRADFRSMMIDMAFPAEPFSR